jgi:hypothetical protein
MYHIDGVSSCVQPSDSGAQKPSRPLLRHRVSFDSLGDEFQMTDPVFLVRVGTVIWPCMSFFAL